MGIEQRISCHFIVLCRRLCLDNLIYITKLQVFQMMFHAEKEFVTFFSQKKKRNSCTFKFIVRMIDEFESA